MVILNIHPSALLDIHMPNLTSNFIKRSVRFEKIAPEAIICVQVTRTCPCYHEVVILNIHPSALPDIHMPNLTSNFIITEREI